MQRRTTVSITVLLFVLAQSGTVFPEPSATRPTGPVSVSRGRLQGSFDALSEKYAFHDELPLHPFRRGERLVVSRDHWAGHAEWRRLPNAQDA